MRAVFLTIISLGVFSFLERHAVFPDPDVFYHAKMALLLRDGFWPDVFPWLPWTVLAQGFSEQHLLYHLVLIPFVTFFSPLVGVKVATVLLASGAVLAFYVLCRALFPRFALLASAILLVTYPFLFRLSLGKAQPLALLLLFLFLLALFRRRALPLFVLSFLAVWTHGSWPLFLLFAGIFFVLSWKSTSESLRLLLSVFLGALAGLIIHPSFPNTFTFLWHQTLQIAVFGVSVRGAGMEWYPPELPDIIAGAPLHVLFFLLSLLFFLIIVEKRTLRLRPLTLFLFSIISVFLFLRSQRHAEFALPLITLSFFSFLSDLVGERRITTVVREFFQETFHNLWMRRITFFIFLLALGTIVVRGFWQADVSLRDGRPMDHLSRIAAWTREHIPEGAMIVTSDWDIFPELFFFDDTHQYSAGLDPRFLQFGDRPRYDAWVKLLSRDTENMRTLLTEDLGGRYFLVAREHEKLFERARNDASLREMYVDDEAAIFEVL